MIMIVIIIAVLLAVVLASVLLPAFVGGAWSPTPMPVVRTMLKRAGVGPAKVVYDLGAGDGRTVITAAKMGARCVAVEVDPVKAWFITLRIMRPNLAKRIEIRRENFFQTDLHRADVVTAYLSSAAMAKLAPKFAQELKPGAIVVSYRRPIPGWSPESSTGAIYIYRMPKAARSKELALVREAVM